MLTVVCCDCCLYKVRRNLKMELELVLSLTVATNFNSVDEIPSIRFRLSKMIKSLSFLGSCNLVEGLKSKE